MDHISIILLAAGNSSRMGQSKQLLNVMGEPLLLRSTKAALQSDVDNVVVVLGAHEQEHHTIIQNLPVQIIYNPHWEKGMGNSLKFGLSTLLKMAPNTEAVIIMVCDQPWLTTEHLKNLILKFQETSNPIIASYYSNNTGVPALFAKSLFQEILLIDDTQGAKKIIQENLSSLIPIDFPNGAVDLDTPADFHHFIQNKKAT